MVTQTASLHKFSVLLFSDALENLVIPRMDQMWCIHTMEYYSALKRKEILAPATTWMNLEDIMLSEISQSQKDKYCMIPPLRGI